LDGHQHLQERALLGVPACRNRPNLLIDQIFELTQTKNVLVALARGETHIFLKKTDAHTHTHTDLGQPTCRAETDTPSPPHTGLD
jgi:hypothetical protein